MIKGGKLLVLCVFISLIFLNVVKAEIIPSDVNPNEIIEDKTGIDPANPPSVDDIKDQYLTTRWNELLLRSPVIAPIHGAFLANQWIFQVIFAEPYSFSSKFLFIVILWFFIALKGSSLLNVATRFGSPYGTIIAIVGTIILAQMKIIYLIANFIYYIAFRQEASWIRIVLSVTLMTVFLIVLNQLFSIFVKMLKNKKKEDKVKKLENEQEADTQFRKGVKEGHEQVESFNKGLKSVSK